MVQSSAGLVSSSMLAGWAPMGGSGCALPSMLVVEQDVHVGLGQLGFYGEYVEQAVDEVLADW